MASLAPEPIFLRDYQAPDFLIETVDLHFDIRDDFTIVKSELLLHINPDALNAPAHLVLDGEALELVSLVLDGQLLQPSDYKKEDVSLTIFNVPAHFKLHIETKIYPATNTALSGLYQSGVNLCTQCEAHGFRRITYFLDRPDVLALFTVTIIADEKKYPILLSNGNCVETKKIKGKQSIKWIDPFKKPCYLFALVAGDLDYLEDFFMTHSQRKVILRIYVEKGNLDKCAHAMAALKKAMRWDEVRFGREYDLDIYMIVAVSDFNMGAMENKGLNIFNTQYILAKPTTATDMDYLHIESVIAHEYCHNWSGNRITCRDWFQLSLKEGLTIFRDQCFTSDTTSPTVARIHDVNDLRNSQFSEDAGPLAHAVQPDSYIEINNFYTATVYNKGAEVIRMQQTLLGEPLFRQGMDYYFHHYDGQAVTIEEFVKSMETVSNKDLTQFRRWYKEIGTPVLTIEDHYDNAAHQYTLTIEQSGPKPLHIPIKIGLLASNGQLLQDSLLELKEKKQIFYFEKMAEKPIPSLLREFSAPVKIQYPYSDDVLLLLFKQDTDLFNRWDAGQKYAVNLILRGINAYQHKEPFNIPDDYSATCHSLFTTLKHDNLLLAQMMTLPSEKYIAEQMSIIDIDALLTVRDNLIHELARQLQTTFIEIYETHHETTTEFSLAAMGKRQLKNLALSYLTQLNDPTFNEKYLLTQFRQSMKNNMTDTIAALRSLLNSTSFNQKEMVLNEFYEYWHHDALVIDKWFALQAAGESPETLTRVKKLSEHPAFDFKNPNKVYSLVGTLGRNFHAFHAANGDGYTFLTDCVLKLDALNPQVAARMLKPMSDWKRYDLNRQALMKKQFERILARKNLSKDVSEIAIKSVGV